MFYSASAICDPYDGAELLKICMSNCDSRTLGTLWREVHGPHRSSEKPFKSINICERYEYTIRLFKRKKSQSPFWKCKWPLIWKKKLESRLPKEAFCRVWLKLTWCFWRRFINCPNVFSLFLYYLLWKKGTTLYLSRLESPLPKSLCDKFAWNWPRRSGEDF